MRRAYMSVPRRSRQSRRAAPPQAQAVASEVAENIARSGYPAPMQLVNRAWDAAVERGWETRSPWQVRVWGMGDWRQDVAQLVAGGELNSLMSAVRKFNDLIVESIEARNGIYSGYLQAKANLDEVMRGSGVDAEDAAEALSTAEDGVRQLARQVQTLGFMDKVFASVASALTAAGLPTDADSVNMTLAVNRKFISETGSMFTYNAVPLYYNTTQQLLSAANAEWKAWGVGTNSPEDPRWLAAYIKAADRIVPVPGRPDAPAAIANAGMGEPTTLVLMVIWTVGIIAASVTAMYGIKKIIEAFNSKAETAKALILQRDQGKQKMLSEMRADGASQAEMDAAAASWDSQTKDQVKDIPDGPFGGLLFPILGGIAGLTILGFVFLKKKSSA